MAEGPSARNREQQPGAGGPRGGGGAEDDIERMKWVQHPRNFSRSRKWYGEKSVIRASQNDVFHGPWTWCAAKTADIWWN